jgi:hypothetical protein
MVKLQTKLTYMNEEQYDENDFQITINGEIYHVYATVAPKDVYRSLFRIESGGKYLFTLSMDEEGQWQVENHLTTMNENLIDQIGKAIEEHDMA